MEGRGGVLQPLAKMATGLHMHTILLLTYLISYCLLQNLGKAIGKASAVTVMVQSANEYKELYDEVYTKIRDTPLPI